MIPPDIPSPPPGTPLPTASEKAPLLSDAVDTGSAPATRSAEQEYRNNVRPPDWRNPAGNGRYNLIVLGAGPAGIAAARLAAQMGGRVALIERGALGGDSLNVGCIPTQTLSACARQAYQVRQAENFGITQHPDRQASFSTMQARVRQVQATISRQDSAQELSRCGIDVFFGAGSFTSTSSIAVGEQTLRFVRALIATGGLQCLPTDIEGAEQAGYLSLDGLLRLPDMPERLMVVGGGPVGTEIAQACCRLGAEVTLVQKEPKFLPEEERDAAQLLAQSLAADGVQIRLNTTAVAVHRKGETRVVTLRSDGRSYDTAVDQVLVGIGRRPNVEGLDLDAAGIGLTPDGRVAVDDFLRTSNPRVYAAGDACMTRRFTQVAEASARLATRNALTRSTRRISHAVLPWCSHTDPEVAHVGLHITDAHARDLSVKTYTVLMHQVDRAITDGERVGFAKIHTRLGTDQIIGATIVARGAGDMVNEITLAMQKNVGLRDLAEVVTAFPARSQTLQLAAQACVADLVPNSVRQRTARRLQRSLR